MSDPRTFRVGIIGSGFGGLCAAIRLQQAGIPFTIYEKNDDIGGTWYENDFPDLRVDVPNHFYSYSFEPNPDCSSFFARRDELKAYIDISVAVSSRAADPAGAKAFMDFVSRPQAYDVWKAKGMDR